MPSKSLTPEEKAKVTSAIPSSSNKIFAAVPARIYFAHPQRDKWSYSGLQGALALTYDKSKDAFIFKLVDFIGTRDVIWQHELYDQFEYYKDRPFFHSFAGDSCMIGVVFSDEKDATLFYKKVTTRKADKATKVSSEPKKVKKGGKIDKSMISAPKVGSFQHVAHVGYDEEKGFTSNNVDESWLSLVRDLEDRGVTADIIEKNKDFIHDFFRQAKQGVDTVGAAVAVPKKKPPPPPVPRRGAHTASDSVTSTNGDSAPSPPQGLPRQPPRFGLPAPPPTPQRSSVAPPNPPPPPPPPVRPNIPPPPPSRPVNSPPAPPPLVVRPTLSPPIAPPPPARPQNGTPPPALVPPPPPPPPPLPPSRAGGPPPLPPVQEDSPSSPPPPPPAPPPPPGAAASAPVPPPQPGRADLLASIRGQSVANLRKTPDPSLNPPPPPAPAAEESSQRNGTGSGGGDLTAALAAALMQRNKKLGDSDEDDDDDEWD